MKALERADNLLAEIGSVSEQFGRPRPRRRRLKAVRERYEGQIGKFKDVLVALEKELIKHMKKNRSQIFDGAD